MVLIQPLGNRVVAGHVQGHVSGCHALGLEILAPRPRGRGGHAALEHEHAGVGQVGAAFSKHRTWPSWVRRLPIVL